MLSDVQSDLTALACPICRGPLSRGSERVACARCAVPYRSEGGIFFMGPPFSLNGGNGGGFDGIDVRMHQLATDAAARGWREAHERFSGEVLSGKLRAPASSKLAAARARVAGRTWEDTLQDLVDPTRGGWKFLLDVRPTSRVCFLGPSWGAAPLALARSTARVVVLDGSLDRLQVIREQAHGAGLANVTLAKVTDSLRLPLGDASVDLVIIPGLAEWFEAVGRGRHASARAGELLLHEVRRLLAPGGQAYLATENRYGISRLLDVGQPQVPRFSASGLQRAASAAGFDRCEVFAPLPFRHKFHQVLDLGRADRMNFCADPYRTRGRLLRPLVKVWDRFNRDGALERRLYGCLPGLGAVLSTDRETKAFAERIFQYVAREQDLAPAAVTLSRYYVRPKGAVVLVGGAPGHPGVIVRLPLAEPAAVTCARQHHALEVLAADERIPETLRRLFPAPLCSGEFEGQTFFAETGLQGELGRLYYSRSEERFDAAIINAADVLCRLRRATEVRVRIDEAQFHRLCGGWLAELRDVVAADKRGALDAITAVLREQILGATLPLGWQHGDYDFANLLYGPDDRVTGILDFEVFDPAGLPLLDLLVLLARRPIREQGFAFGTLFVQSILQRTLPPVESGIVARELETLGIDDRRYRALALCCWLNHLRLRRDSWLVRSPSWLEENLHTVLESVRRIL
jgi:aminoglycoside phosphotransferase (APT) family kinase protein/SAM-dependent methyltransferase